MKPHYYVYCLTAGKPTVRHATLAEAQQEAERMAAKEPGRAFEILRCVGIAQCSQASTFWMDGEGPPEKPRYRMLDEGEPIEDGDEFRWGGEWNRSQCAGQKYSNVMHAPHRRPL